MLQQPEVSLLDRHGALLFSTAGSSSASPGYADAKPCRCARIVAFLVCSDNITLVRVPVGLFFRPVPPAEFTQAENMARIFLRRESETIDAEHHHARGPVRSVKRGLPQFPSSNDSHCRIANAGAVRRSKRDGSKLELEELILRERLRALRLFLEVVLCGKRAN